MNKQYYAALDEKLYCETLPNGLHIMVCPRPGFTKKLCYFATDFGAVHREFTLDGQKHTTPAGIAHYLEHKMFDTPQGDVSRAFAARGASVNAFTSYDMTAYYFSCTEHFEECLALLLEFVSTPYFTEETVQRERPIIGQEIAMSLDEPGSRVFENLMPALYAHHPIRTPVLGTQEEIEKITPELLRLCHRAFYNPANMLLCVVGDVDADGVAAIARRVLGDEARPMAEKADFPQEEMRHVRPLVEEKMPIAMPLFSMAIKATCPEKGEPAIRREIIGDLAAEALFGESSALYLQLYRQGLIDSSFGGGFDTVDGCAMLSCGGDSDDPQAVRDAILARGAEIARQGIAQEDFLRMKRSAMGRRIRDLDSFDATCFRLCAYRMSEFDYFRFPELYDSIEGWEVQAFLAEVVRPEGCSLSVIYPTKEET
jgi:predicted Zn-dependent peptidase